MSTNKILETLKLQPISEEEKARRHILGRLYGPIATFGDSTRNGRYYNKQLWEKALSDEIFLEKVANKSLFLELEHPADRDTIDMKLACACIPEVPKIIGDDLYAVIDILDTPNGKLLKTFVDYGFVPGISSRGSGDVDSNNEVDPETFFLETWDIVSLPAVKKARLSVCESFDPKQQKLQKALLEAYNTSSEEDKAIMKNTLNNLNVPLTESKVQEINGVTVIRYNSIDEVPINNDSEEFFDESIGENLEEDSKQFEDKDAEEEYFRHIQELSTDHEDPDAEECDDCDEDEDEDEDDVEESLKEAEEAEETEEDPTADEDEEKADNSDEAITTVGDVIKSLKEYDKKLPVEFGQVTIDDKVYDTELSVSYAEGDDKVTIGVNCIPTEDDNENIDAENSDDETPEADVAEDSAEDAGDDEVIESLKEAIRQKDLLENEIKNLRSSKTVSDAKVAELNESLIKYKTAFERTSELAAKAKSLKNENASLTEQLSQKDSQIKRLSEQAQKAKALNESVNGQNAKVKTLTEKLGVMQKEFDAEKTKLNEQLAQYKKGYADRTAVAKSYKEKFNTVLTRYIESKAQMLGVRPADITCKLRENYTIDDVDNACQAILDGSIKINRIPVSKNAKIRINESVGTNNALEQKSNDSYDVDDSLLELAGLTGMKFN